MADEIHRDLQPPVWRQLANILRRQIEEGEITSRVPSETSLSQRYGVARLTARRAVDLLVEEGLVEREPGRGTFVVPEDERPSAEDNG